MTPAAVIGLGWIALAGAGGYVLVSRSAPALTIEETIGWSWGAGTLIFASTEALFLATGIAPGPKKFLALFALLAVAAFARKAAPGRGASYGRIPLLFFAVALAGCATYALQACAEPLWSTDFLAIWGMKAKTIYFTGAIPDRIFHDRAVSWSHPDYPLLLPIVMAAFSSATGSWNDETLGLLYVAWQVATVLVLIGYCRRRSSALAGTLVAALVAWFHPLYRGFGTGLADIPLAFALLLLCSAAADRSAGRAALAALLAVATKQEGTLFVVLIALLVLFWPAADRPRRGRGRTALAILVVAAAHLLSMRLLRGSVANRDFTLARLGHPGSLLEAMERLAPAFVGSFHGPLLLGVIGVAVALFAMHRSREDFLLVALILQISAYLSACLLSAYDPVWQLQGFFRTSAALAPSLALVVGCRATALKLQPATVAASERRI